MSKIKEYVVWGIIGIISVLILIEFSKLSERDKDREFCYLYTHEKTDDRTWQQHDHPLISEMMRESRELPQFNDMEIWVVGDGELNAWTFDESWADCSYKGYAQKGNVLIPFEVRRGINVTALKEWRNQW